MKHSLFRAQYQQTQFGQRQISRTEHKNTEKVDHKLDRDKSKFGINKVTQLVQAGQKLRKNAFIVYQLLNGRYDLT